VIVVRYFGGTLLGIPGLIHAYKTVTSLALQLTPIVEKPIMVNYELEFDYTLMNDVMTIVKKFNCEVLSKEMQLFCRVKIGIPKDKELACAQNLGELYGLQLKK
jgi:putative IMPACT (imprinted ancient) family translation regulator